jgi:hypothetical protein
MQYKFKIPKNKKDESAKKLTASILIAKNEKKFKPTYSFGVKLPFVHNSRKSISCFSLPLPKSLI